MPSLRTRTRYQGIALAQADEAIAAATAGLTQATTTLDAIETGTLDLDAVTIGGQRFVNNGGNLEVEP